MSKVTGATLRAFRENNRWDQTQLAMHLNEKLRRKYQKANISRWETEGQRIPVDVANLITASLPPPSAPTLPAHKVEGPALVLAVANQKGGVGKTTAAVNVAYSLAADGYSVLLIDADPQANATMHLAIDPYEVEKSGRTLSQALTVPGVELADIAIPIDLSEYGVFGPLALIASSIDLAKAENALSSMAHGAMIMRRSIARARTCYDFVIIDCPPHLGKLTESALTAADFVLIPTQTAPFSFMGIPHLTATLTAIQELANPNLRVLGILPTMFNARLSQDAQTLIEIKTQYGSTTRVFEPIPRATNYEKASASGAAAVILDRRIPGIDTFKYIAATLIAEKAEQGASHGD
jgi:chromosome partitioning protein